jgi:hypothetical protein
MCVDFVGYWLTTLKAWQAPHSETLISWVLATLAALLGVLAVGQYTLNRAIYPIFAVVAQGSLALVIFLRRRVKRVNS